MNTITESKNISGTKTISFAWLAAWAIASGIGLTVGTIGTLMGMWNLGENTLNSIPLPLQPVIGGAVLGFAICLTTGLAQWLVLRARGIHASRWLAGSISGGTVGGMVMAGVVFGLNQYGDSPVIILAAFTVLGAVLGGTQSLLAPEITRKAEWIVASAVGVGGSAVILLGSSSADINPVIGALGGLVYGILTAAVLWRGAHK